jgi:YD repeat-containing protein
VITLKNATTTLQSFTYSGAPSGDILSETDTPSSPTSPAGYAYDAQSRVTSMTPGSNPTLNYGYDASANLTTTPSGARGTYDNASELTSATPVGHHDQRRIRRRWAAADRQAGLCHHRLGYLEWRPRAHRLQPPPT